MLRGPSWSRAEVEAVVADYFAMLEKELRGIPYNKTEHRRALRPLLSNRSDPAIERKHQNITAILIEAGFPYIRGYKPLSQYQGLLADVVFEHIEEDAVLSQLALAFAEATAGPVQPSNILGLMTSPPAVLESVRSAIATNLHRRYARRIDYLAREARNRALGTSGETLVVSYERARLSSLGLDNLADRVEHVSVTRGDGLGYDVLSFSPAGREHFIEVKTTQLGPLTPFYVTAGEMSFSGEHEESYSLYRVYDFATDPRMFSLAGRVDVTCRVMPAQYVAVPR
ncbi:MAG TPA: DUF3883 domain-containing protein [Thermoanaerobaculia bacterium]